MEELVTVAEFDNVNMAYVLKSRLEAEGISVFLKNENMNTLFPTSTFTRVQLQVRFLDSFRAMDIIYDN